MSSIVDILCRRDGITRAEATERVRETKWLVKESQYDYDTVEQILNDELGLEMDYIFDLI